MLWRWRALSVEKSEDVDEVVEENVEVREVVE